MFWPLMKDCITQEDKDSLVQPMKPEVESLMGIPVIILT